MALTFQTESLFPDLFFEMKPLLERHWDEIALKDAFGPVDIDETLIVRCTSAECCT